MRTVVGIRSGQRIARTANQENDPAPTIWFDSWRQMAGVLSDENRALLKLILEKRPRTVMELAELSGRAASNLSRTLRTLEGHGLVRLHRSPDEALATQFLVVLDPPQREEQ